MTQWCKKVREIVHVHSTFAWLRHIQIWNDPLMAARDTEYSSSFSSFCEALIAHKTSGANSLSLSLSPCLSMLHTEKWERAWRECAVLKSWEWSYKWVKSLSAYTYKCNNPKIKGIVLFSELFYMVIILVPLIIELLHVYMYVIQSVHVLIMGLCIKQLTVLITL